MVPQPQRRPDGTFIIDELYTAEYRFVLYPLPPGAYLRSISVGGREFVDSPMMIQGGETIDGLVFTVSTKAGALNGVVKDEVGGVVPDAIVILQPEPRHAETDIHRCIQTADQNSGFACQNIAPGKYRIAAWRKFPDGLDVAEDTISSSGTPVEVSEGSTITMTVPLVTR